MSNIGNEKTHGESLRNLSDNLSYLHDICYRGDSYDGLPSLSKCQDDLFHAVSVIGDRGLSEAVLRMVLKVEFETHDKNTLESVNQYYIGDREEKLVPFKDFSPKHCEALDYCWDLAESLVGVLERYSKSNGIPDFSAWRAAIPHEEFPEFVRSLYDVTRGFLSETFFPDDLLYLIAHEYADFGYEHLVLPMEYLDKLYSWVLAKFPQELRGSNESLFGFCAELVKYEINLPDEPMLVCPSGAVDILTWRPAISLPCLCRSYLMGLPSSYCEWENFWMALEGVTADLPGNMSNQLLGVFYTNNDPQVRKGAVAIMMQNFGSMEDSDRITLVRGISEIKRQEERTGYTDLLPSPEEVREQFQDESLATKYEEYLKAIQA